MNVGERIVAQVLDIKDNGIFVRHEGLVGIITIVELTWDERTPPNPSDFANPKDTLELLVMSANSTGFHGSLKRLHPEDDPWKHPALKDGGRFLHLSVPSGPGAFL